MRFEQCVNVAGAYADRVAHQFGLGQDYLSLPFKGTYMTLTEERNHWVNGNIYPVPDLRNPFLGVHLSRNADGQVYVGPTAIPAFGRENYGITRGLGRESLSILYRDALMFARNSGFRTAAVREMRKYVPRYIYREAKKLVPALERADVLTSAKVGIRPQLVHWPTKQLVGDYVIERDDRSLHLLNAISPAFTSSMAFAPYVVSMLTNPDAEQSGSPSNQVV
ncbi:MAG: NAD(P)/FAD-dependent oxidoreductase [Salinibacter sp.]